MPNLNTPIEIWEKSKTETKNELGHKVYKDKQIAACIFAEVTSKSGSMLYGRPADTILAKTTHKIVYRYDNFPGLTEEHYIKINGKKYDIDYCDNRNLENKWMDVFVSTKVRKQ